MGWERRAVPQEGPLSKQSALSLQIIGHFKSSGIRCLFFNVEREREGNDQKTELDPLGHFKLSISNLR